MKDEAEEVFTSWMSNFLGSETLIKKAVNPENTKINLLFKGEPTELKNSEIEKLLANYFEGIKASRFIKKDRTNLETVDLFAKNLNDAERVIRGSIFIEKLLYRPTIFQ